MITVNDINTTTENIQEVEQLKKEFTDILSPTVKDAS
jgi:hypothetical protein